MKNNRYDRFFRRKGYLSPIVGVADTSPEGGSKLCHCEPQARQSPGRVNFRMLLSPIVGVADTSPEGGSKKCVILSVSEISHDLSDKVYACSVLRWDSSLRSE